MRCFLFPTTAALISFAQSTAALTPVSFQANKLLVVKNAVAAATTLPSLIRPSSSRNKKLKLVDKIFQEADTNKDGYVDFAEAYELVLKIYCKLNRQAPIEPPSKATIEHIFLESDVDNDKRISRTEFSSLASVLIRRAMLRLVSHKAVSLIGAPILAETVVRLVARKKWGFEIATRILPPKMLPVLTSMAFWRTFLLVFFVVSLGNVVLGIVNFFLDYAIKRKMSANAENNGSQLGRPANEDL